MVDPGSQKDVDEFRCLKFCVCSLSLHSTRLRHRSLVLRTGQLVLQSWKPPYPLPEAGIRGARNRGPFCSPSIRCRVARPRPSHSLEPAFTSKVKSRGPANYT